jgi:hypothetical protein
MGATAALADIRGGSSFDADTNVRDDSAGLSHSQRFDSETAAATEHNKRAHDHEKVSNSVFHDIPLFLPRTAPPSWYPLPTPAAAFQSAKSSERGSGSSTFPVVPASPQRRKSDGADGEGSDSADNDRLPPLPGDSQQELSTRPSTGTPTSTSPDSDGQPLWSFGLDGVIGSPASDDDSGGDKPSTGSDGTTSGASGSTEFSSCSSDGSDGDDGDRGLGSGGAVNSKRLEERDEEHASTLVAGYVGHASTLLRDFLGFQGQPRK